MCVCVWMMGGKRRAPPPAPGGPSVTLGPKVYQFKLPATPPVRCHRKFAPRGYFGQVGTPSQ